MVATDKKISLLIPTFCRYGKLARNLIYLHEMANSELIETGRSKDIEVIIADGTPSEANADDSFAKQFFWDALSAANKALDITYLELPGASYFERLYELVNVSSADLVTMLGDEDLFVFDALDDIYALFSEHDINAVAGRFIDIHGYSRGKLKYSLHEGWFNEYKIESKSALNRLRGFLVSRGIGTPSTSYSVNPREFMLKVAKKMADNDKVFSYTNCQEFWDNYRIASGSMYSICRPLYLRDRTFVGRFHDDPRWSDSSLDGKMRELLFEAIDECSEDFNSPSEVAEFFSDFDKGFEVTNQGHLYEMRHLMDAAQPWLSSYLASTMKKSTVEACEKSWKTTIDFAYPGTPKSHLGIPSFWKRAAYKLYSLIA